MASNFVWLIMIKVGRVPEIEISAINREKCIASDLAFPLQGQSFDM